MPQQQLYKFRAVITRADGTVEKKDMVRGGSKRRITVSDTENHIRNVLYRHERLQSVHVDEVREGDPFELPADVRNLIDNG